MTPPNRRLLTSRAKGWACLASCRFLFLLLALILAGCGATAADSPGGASTATRLPPSGRASQVDRYVAPVILRNPAPSALDVSLSVTIDQQTGDTQSMVEIGLSISSGGRIVQFAGDERVTCNGAALSLKDRAAVFQVLRAPAARVAGTTIHCDYEAGGAVASVSLQIPSAPAITSPIANAQVARGARTIVTYRADPATSTVLGIVALAPGLPSPKAIARLNTPGPSQATVDTSGFAPGPGLLVLTVSLTPHLATTGAPFKSVRTFGTATVPITITWT